MIDIKTFSALAEPNRFNIVELLRGGPMQVNDIVEELDLNQPQVSKHLMVLTKADIVNVKKLKQKRIYSLKQEKFKEIDDWATTYTKLWNDRLDRLELYLEKNNKEVTKTQKTFLGPLNKKQDLEVKNNGTKKRR